MALIGARGPSSARTGSPGTRWIIANDRTSSSRSRMIIRPIRRSRKAAVGCLSAKPTRAGAARLTKDVAPLLVHPDAGRLDQVPDARLVLHVVGVGHDVIVGDRDHVDGLEQCLLGLSPQVAAALIGRRLRGLRR